MKLTSLVLILICAVVIPGTAAADDVTHHANGNAADQKSGNRHVTQHNRSLAGAKVAGENHIRPTLSNNGTHPATSNPVLPRRVVPSTPALHSDVRHRGLNPAVIGGAAKSDAKNTSAINGTPMNRRRY